MASILDRKVFNNYLRIISESLNKDDYATYRAACDMLDEAVNTALAKKKLMEEADTDNFGILNNIFEDALPVLFKKNQKAVRDVIKLIKEDVNLSSQFAFYNNIRKYMRNDITEGDCLEMVENLIESATNEINKNTVKESNRKLKNILKENKIYPSELLNEDLKKMYLNADRLLTERKKLKNTLGLMECANNVAEYMFKHKSPAVEEKDPLKDLNEFEKKLGENLTESEVSFVKEITAFRNPIAESKKKKLFDSLKEQCIKKMDEMLSEDNNNAEILALKEKISNKEYCSESIVKDIANMMEIRDLLFEK